MRDCWERLNCGERGEVNFKVTYILDWPSVRNFFSCKKHRGSFLSLLEDKEQFKVEELNKKCVCKNAIMCKICLEDVEEALNF